MQHLSRFAALSLLLSLASTGALSGCAKHKKNSTEQPSQSGGTTEFPADMELSDGASRIHALNTFARLSLEDPQREIWRNKIIAALSQDIEKAIFDKRPERAIRGFELALSLFHPSELHQPKPDELLWTNAEQLYRQTSREGNELPSLFALGIMQHFGSAQHQAELKKQMDALVEWIDKGGDFSRDPSEGDNLERLLEQTTAIFPSPWLTQQLVTQYKQRYEEAKRSHSRISTATKTRLQFTGYLIVRAYLRADDLNRALQELKSVESDSVGTVDQNIVDALDAAVHQQDPNALRALMQMFQPAAEETLPPAVQTQGWGITQSLSQRLLKIDKNDIDAHLGLARSHRYNELFAVAQIHYERALALADDRFDAWSELAEVYQRRLEEISDHDPQGAAKFLSIIEDFHLRAASSWPDRPLSAPLGDAYTTVGAALYDAGQPESSQDLMLKVLQLDPRPEAYDLLGLLSIRSSDLPRAEGYYRSIAQLPFEDPYSRINWEIRADIQLGEIIEKMGDSEGSRKHFNTALAKLNKILRLPNLKAEHRAARLSDRANIFFHLGETKLAIADFRTAATLVPGRAQTYTGPILFTVTHGLLSDTKTIYQKALADKELQDGLKLYLSLWVHELEQRTATHNQNDRAVSPSPAFQYLSTFKGTPWAQALAKHALGQLSFQQLLAQSSKTGEQAEAHFYEALKLWKRGEQQKCFDMLEQVLKSQMVSFFEYEMAQAYLQWKRVPSVN